MRSTNKKSAINTAACFDQLKGEYIQYYELREDSGAGQFRVGLLWKHLCTSFNSLKSLIFSKQDITSLKVTGGFKVRMLKVGSCSV